MGDKKIIVCYNEKAFQIVKYTLFIYIIDYALNNVKNSQPFDKNENQKECFI